MDQIQVENLVKTYRGAAQPALRDVSLRVPTGSVFGLLGPNGAGKSTLIGALLGLIQPDSGSITVGRQPDSSDGALLGMVPQEAAFYATLSVAENLAFFAAVRGFRGADYRRERDRVCRITSLDEHLAARAGRLSGGLQRRLNLAIGLLGKPRVLCLDEPTVGVDPHSRHFLLESIRALAAEGGVTVLYASHYMDEVEALCDRVAILDDGEVLCSGRLDELLGGQAQEVSLRFPESPDQTQLAAFTARFPTARMDGRAIHLRADDPLELLPDLSSHLRAAGLRPSSLHYGTQNLETLFLRLTGRQLRD